MKINELLLKSIIFLHQKETYGSLYPITRFRPSVKYIEPKKLSF